MQAFNAQKGMKCMNYVQIWAQCLTKWNYAIQQKFSLPNINILLQLFHDANLEFYL